MLADLHHVGQVVDDFDAALAFYRDTLGCSVAHLEESDAIRIAFLQFPSVQVHLIAREGPGTGIDDLLDTLLAYDAAHLAFTVDDVAAAMQIYHEAGFETWTAEPEDGLGPYRRCFALPGDHPGMPFEFVEEL